MKRTLIAIAAATIACSVAMPADAAKKKAKPKAAPCTSAANVEALNVRALQTELMVGALACGERERYNAFVQARQPELVPYAKTLQRMHGKRTNAFVTRVANEAARNADCAAMSALFDEVLGPATASRRSPPRTSWRQGTATRFVGRRSRRRSERAERDRIAGPERNP